MSNSVRPQRWQPTRLLCPWDSPGKNTGVGCHILVQCMKVQSESEVAQSCPTLSDPMDCSLPGFSVDGIFQARVLEWGAIAFSSFPMSRWPKYWSFSFSISPSNEYSGLISFRIGLVGSPCSPRDSQESSPTPQFKSINSLALSFLYSLSLTYIHDHWKNHSFD